MIAVIVFLFTAGMLAVLQALQIALDWRDLREAKSQLEKAKADAVALALTRCSHCQGKGYYDGASVDVCWHCNGTGRAP